MPTDTFKIRNIEAILIRNGELQLSFEDLTFNFRVGRLLNGQVDIETQILEHSSCRNDGSISTERVMLSTTGKVLLELEVFWEDREVVKKLISNSIRKVRFE